MASASPSCVAQFGQIRLARHYPAFQGEKNIMMTIAESSTNCPGKKIRQMSFAAFQTNPADPI